MVLQGGHAFGGVIGCGVQLACYVVQAVATILGVSHSASAGYGLNAPQARADRAFVGDEEGADLAGAGHVGAAAELFALEAGNAYLAHDGTILLAEEGHRAFERADW